MNVLAGKYPRDRIFFWVGKSTQNHRSDFIMLCPVGEEGWILPRSDLGDSLVTSYLPEHNGCPEHNGFFSLDSGSHSSQDLCTSALLLCDA